MQKASQAYFQTQLTTVGQGELLLLLYDGALKFLAQAKEKIIAKDYAAKGVLISKALDIINELDSSLNESAGGELARNLHQLYFLCSTKMLEANMRMNPETLDISINILTGLRSAYAQIINTPEARAAGAQIASKQSPTSATAHRSVPLPGAGMAAPGSGLGKAAGTAAYKSVGGLGGTPSFGNGTAPGLGAPAAPPVQAAQSLQAAVPQQARPTTPPPAMPSAGQAGASAIPPAAVSANPAASPAAPSAPPVDLAPRRSVASALYGKMAQS